MDALIALGGRVVWKSPTSWCVHLPAFLSASEDLKSRAKFMESGFGATLGHPVRLSSIARANQLDWTAQPEPMVFWVVREKTNAMCADAVKFEALAGDVVVCCDIPIGFVSSSSFCVCLFK